MDRQSYILQLNKNELTLDIYYLFFKEGKGKLEFPDFAKNFPLFYNSLFPHIQAIINNRVIMYLDNLLRVNIVIDKEGNLIKRY